MKLIKVNAWFRASAIEWMDAADYFEQNGSDALASTIRKGVLRQQARDKSWIPLSDYRETRRFGLRLQDGSVDRVRSYMRIKEIS